MPTRSLRIEGEPMRLPCSAEEHEALGALGGPGAWSAGALAALAAYLGREPTWDALHDALGDPITARVREVLLAVVGHEPWSPDPSGVELAQAQFEAGPPRCEQIVPTHAEMRRQRRPRRE